MTSLQPLSNNVLFKFLDETKSSDGKFMERTKGSIVIGAMRDTQNSSPRWGQVIATGPKVQDVSIGEYILIEAGKWTVGVNYEDEGKVWKTDDNWIMLSTDDLADTFSY